VYEAFSRFFRKANPEPKGELEHLNPYTLLVAVVSVGAGRPMPAVNKANGAPLFAGPPTRPQKMPGARRGKKVRANTSDHRALSQQGEERSSRCRKKLIAEFGQRGAGAPARSWNRCRAPGRKTANVVLNMAFGGTHHGGGHACVFGSAIEQAWPPGDTAARGGAWPRAVVIPPEFHAAPRITG